MGGGKGVAEVTGVRVAEGKGRVERAGSWFHDGEGLGLPPLHCVPFLVSVLSPCRLVLLLVRDGLVQSVQGRSRRKDGRGRGLENVKSTENRAFCLTLPCEGFTGSESPLC